MWSTCDLSNGDIIIIIIYSHICRRSIFSATAELLVIDRDLSRYSRLLMQLKLWLKRTNGHISSLEAYEGSTELSSQQTGRNNPPL